ncbi:hypothetical protein [Haloferax sp. DFSO52]|uniref:hypothetical protein n=1 Tax=Haloferax sp. DFSO52 TaxID=3388505 RepID=UPI003A8596D5
MNRRAFLFTAGAISLGGCIASDPPAGTPTTTTAPTTTTTATPTRTTPETTTPETTTETETPETPDEVEQTLNQITVHLDRTVERYAAAAGKNKGFLDLNSTSRFSFNQNAEHLYAARELFYDIETASEDQRERQSRLRDVYWFLWWAGKSFEQLGEANRRSKNAVSRFYLGEYDQVSSRADEIVSAVEDAKKAVSSMKEESKASSLGAITALKPAAYTKTVAQIETELSVFERFADLVASLSSHVLELDQSFSEYLEENYDGAASSFYRLSREFEDLHGSLAETTKIAAVKEPLSEFGCMTDALANGCRVLQDAAMAGMNGLPEKQMYAEGDAKDEFEECDLVPTELEMVTAFFDDLPRQRT